MRLRLTAVVMAALVVSAVAVSAAASPSAEPLYAFGLNASGQLGVATNSTPNPTPALVTLPEASGSISQIATGAYYSLVVTSSGQLYSFGENVYGQLGRSTAKSSEPTPALVTLPGATGTVTNVAAGYGQSLAVTSSGQLYSFGSNLQGQLGVTTNFGGDSPTAPALVTLPGASGGVVQVAAGSAHSLALTSSGQLYAFGYNEEGQLGNSDRASDDTPTLVKLPVDATGTITQIAAGGYHSLALTSTGQLYDFGENGYGQLGSSNELGKEEKGDPTPTIVALPESATGTITQVTAGFYSTLVLTSTGQLYGFGYNYYGQLGNGTNNGVAYAYNQTPTLVTLPGATGSISQIASGHYDSLVVTSTGQLYAFGDNEDGQLGSSTNSGEATANPTPTVVGTGAEVVGSGPSAYHTLVVGNFQTPCECSTTTTSTSTSLSTSTATTTSTQTTQSTTTQPLTVVSSAQIAAGLAAQLTPSGNAATISVLLKSGAAALSTKALEGGTLVIDWYYLPPGAKLAKKTKTKAKPVLVATGTHEFSGAATATIKIKLTGAGKRLLKHAKKLKLTAMGTFTPTGKTPVSSTRAFLLKR